MLPPLTTESTRINDLHHKKLCFVVIAYGLYMGVLQGILGQHCAL